MRLIAINHLTALICYSIFFCKTNFCQDFLIESLKEQFIWNGNILYNYKCIYCHFERPLLNGRINFFKKSLSVIACWSRRWKPCKLWALTSICAVHRLCLANDETGELHLCCFLNTNISIYSKMFCLSHTYEFPWNGCWCFGTHCECVRSFPLPSSLMSSSSSLSWITSTAVCLVHSFTTANRSEWQRHVPQCEHWKGE